MYTTNRTLPRKLLALAMALAMALTMTVSAFASDVRPWYTDKVVITGSVDAATKTYSVTVKSSSDTTQVKMEATLYQKQLIGRKEISTMSKSVSGYSCSQSKSAAIESGKTYVIEVTAKVYSGGSWDTIKETITAKT